MASGAEYDILDSKTHSPAITTAKNGTPSPTVNPIISLSRCESPPLPPPLSLLLLVLVLLAPPVVVLLCEVVLGGGVYDFGLPLVGSIDSTFVPKGIALVTDAYVLAGYVAEAPEGIVRTEV